MKDANKLALEVLIDQFCLDKASCIGVSSAKKQGVEVQRYEWSLFCTL